MHIFQEVISEHIWDVKYRYRLKENNIDHSVEDTWQRVAKAVAGIEKKHQQAQWEKKFYDVLKDFHFLPGGRILAGAGTQLDVTLFNCFVMPILEDSLQGIFTALQEAALTLQKGGGVGYDFSILRPRGFLVPHTGTLASGPVSFMRIWDAMCATMQSSGARRGAMMGILRCDHPDIEEFISAKSNPDELRHFNVSVLVSDAFMQAVEKDSEWELIFPATRNSEPNSLASRVVSRVKARTLWQKIIKSAYDYAEPGVLFEDTINSQNNLWYREWISATNPCGEIPLPAYGACNLGAINLTQFVRNPFKQNASIDWNKLTETTAIATRFLDNVIDLSPFPLPAQKLEAHGTRRIGLGVTGVGDLLVMLGMRYGNEDALQFIAKLMQQIAETTWQTSLELAEERGAFPYCEVEKYLQGHFVQKLPREIQLAIEKKGVRNSHHNTIAPTGTISLLANNVSNGIEPVFSPHYERTMRSVNGELIKFSVTDYVLRLWQKTTTEKKLPDAWVDSQSLLPQDHLKMQAAVQPYIDNAISKTINLPVDFPFEKLHAVYSEAYYLGLKGCTIYRPNAITGSVLSLTDSNDGADRCCQFL